MYIKSTQTWSYNSDNLSYVVRDRFINASNITCVLFDFERTDSIENKGKFTLSAILNDQTKVTIIESFDRESLHELFIFISNLIEKGENEYKTKLIVNCDNMGEVITNYK